MRGMALRPYNPVVPSCRLAILGLFRGNSNINQFHRDARAAG
jgi:hypothetical protein